MPAGGSMSKCLRAHPPQLLSIPHSCSVHHPQELVWQSCLSDTRERHHGFYITFSGKLYKYQLRWLKYFSRRGQAVGNAVDTSLAEMPTSGT